VELGYKFVDNRLFLLDPWVVQFVGFSVGLCVVQDGLSVQTPFCRVRANRTEWTMPVPDSHFATHCFLLLKLVFLYAAPHPHAQEINIPNMEDVEKIAYATCKQAQRNKAETKQKLAQTLSCGSLKIPTCHKEKMRRVLTTEDGKYPD
jgi:hypothetical protein